MVRNEKAGRLVRQRDPQWNKTMKMLPKTKPCQPEHNPILRARRKPNSLRAAINAMCAACMGCSEQMIEPGFRNEIRDCSAPDCPLWLHRPYQPECEGQDGHRSDLESTFASGVVPMAGGRQ